MSLSVWLSVSLCLCLSVCLFNSLICWSSDERVPCWVVQYKRSQNPEAEIFYIHGSTCENTLHVRKMWYNLEQSNHTIYPLIKSPSCRWFFVFLLQTLLLVYGINSYIYRFLHLLLVTAESWSTIRENGNHHPGCWKFDIIYVKVNLFKQYTQLFLKPNLLFEKLGIIKCLKLRLLSKTNLKHLKLNEKDNFALNNERKDCLKYSEMLWC